VAEFAAEQGMNKTGEAYTGNLAGRKGARTSLKQFSLVTVMNKQTATVS